MNKYRPIVNNGTRGTTTSSASPDNSGAPASVVVAVQSAVSPPTTRTTEATARTTTSSSAKHPAATTSSLTDCPAANGTTYTVPGSDKKFLRLCGVDYSGTGAAVDLSHLPTTSMDDCMNNCAGTSGCTACGWGPINSSTTNTDRTGVTGGSGKDYECYLKSTLGSASKAKEADSDWCFAIMQ